MKADLEVKNRRVAGTPCNPRASRPAAASVDYMPRYSGDPMNLIDDLNPEQKAAVVLPDESALILAGAGSGKTRVLTTRIAWLLQNGRVSPAGLLAVTFTNKAAREMLVRIESMLAVNPRGMWIGTFHGLCNRLLRAHHRDANLPATFQILDVQDQLSSIKRLLKASNVDEQTCAPRDLQFFINQAKDSGRRAADLSGSGHDRRWIELYAAYDAQCQREGSVDFAELLLRSVELLTRHEPLREHYQTRFRHILVDEFQDTNVLQYRWLKLLSGRRVPIFAVGDDDQSIYRFRGANVGNMADFQREFDVRHLVKLEQNYRSHGNILDAANHLIGNNTRRLGKRLWTDAGPGEKLRLFEGGSDGLEAAWVVDEVRDRVRNGVPLSRIAILYRSNAQSRILEHALFGAGIPYRVYGGQRFFERAEIKHALAYLRLAANPDDDTSFLRVVNFPPRGIGARSVEQLQAAASARSCSLFTAMAELAGRSAASLAQFGAIIHALQQASLTASLADLVQMVIDRSGLVAHYRSEKDGADRVENLSELVNAASGFVEEHDGGFEADVPAPPASDAAPDDADAPAIPAMLQAFLSHASLEAGDNQTGAGDQALQMMTVHAAKGLEFDTVFLSGLEEGLFPHENSLSEADGLEEERRLMYVAVTRAQRRLYLSFAQSRMLHGQTRYGMRSRFVDELPAATLELLAPRLRPSFSPAPQPAWSSAGAARFSGSRPQGAGSATTAVPAWRAPAGAGAAPLAQAGGGSKHGLRVGQSVRHAKFGDGVVVRLQGSGTDERAQINFGAFGTKELLLSVAKIEPR